MFSAVLDRAAGWAADAVSYWFGNGDKYDDDDDDDVDQHQDDEYAHAEARVTLDLQERGEITAASGDPPVPRQNQPLNFVVFDSDDDDGKKKPKRSTPWASMCDGRMSCQHRCRDRQSAIDTFRAEMIALQSSNKDAFTRTLQAVLWTAMSSNNDTRWFVDSTKDTDDAPPERKKCTFRYSIPNIGRVCKETLHYAFAVNHKVVDKLQKHVREDGMAAVVHANTGGAAWARSPKHAAKINELKNWLRNFVQSNALLLPGRGGKLITHVLPATDSRRRVYAQYCGAYQAGGGPDAIPLSWGVFRTVFKTDFPYVSAALRRTDICDYCWSYMYLWGRVRDPEQLELNYQRYLRHREVAAKRRQLYDDDIKAFDGMQRCYDARTVMLNVDFAQNISLPYYADQPGKIFFSSPYAVHILGIWNSATHITTIYLISEHWIRTMGKGHDLMISLLHHYLQGPDALLCNPSDEHSEKISPENIKFWYAITAAFAALKLCFTFSLFAFAGWTIAVAKTRTRLCSNTRPIVFRAGNIRNLRFQSTLWNQDTQSATVTGEFRLIL